MQFNNKKNDRLIAYIYFPRKNLAFSLLRSYTFLLRRTLDLGKGRPCKRISSSRLFFLTVRSISRVMSFFIPGPVMFLSLPFQKVYRRFRVGTFENIIAGHQNIGSCIEKRGCIAVVHSSVHFYESF